MKSDLIAAYAKLTTLNTYEGNQDNIGTIYDIKINNNSQATPFKFVLIGKSDIDNETGYQGHIYKNIANGDIIVVHEGSIPLNQILKKPREVNKDWYKANMNTLMGEVNKQFESAEDFVDLAKKIAKIESSTGKVIMVGQSLGGTLSELVGALSKNKDIEIYTFNSFGAGYLLNDLVAMGKTVSGDYSNIKNLTYSNEFPTKINPHIGNVFKSEYIAPKSDESPSIHSVQAHYKPQTLEYQLDSNYPTILRNENTTQAVKHAIFKTNPVVNIVENSEVVNNKKEQLVNILQNSDAIKLQTSMDNYIYTVKQGETIKDISNRAGISYEKLIDANPWLMGRYSTDGNFLIHAGEKIFIPLDEVNIMETNENEQLKSNSVKNDFKENPENRDIVSEITEMNNNKENSGTLTGGAAGISDKFVNPNYSNRNSVKNFAEDEVSSPDNEIDFFKTSMKELMKHQRSFRYDAKGGKEYSVSTISRKLDEITKTLDGIQKQLDYHEKVVNIYNTPELAVFYLHDVVDKILADILDEYILMMGYNPNI